MRTPKTVAKLMHRSDMAVPGIMLAFFLAIGGCETGPPVQEMSDARMAISVARDAGAAQLAPNDLRAAESLLHSAQKNLSLKAYTLARTNAIAAKNRALDALENAENSDGSEPRLQQ